MRWEGGEQSSNIEDRRGAARRVRGVRGFGLGTIIIALIGGWILGINPLQLLGALGGVQTPVQQTSAVQNTPVNDAKTKFISTVLRDTEVVWEDIFNQSGAHYAQPKLVLFSGSTPTACGTGNSATGPFYCPLDQKVYLDTQFFQTLRNELGGGGDFAEAYVIAHEVGHHVQNLTGILKKTQALRGRVSQAEYNAIQVRVELQADCFAGLWANHTHERRNIIEAGDIEKAMNTAAKIGDDAIQKRTHGHVVPDSFTHGSSAQRVRWFMRGLETGSVQACDTFNAQKL